MKRVALFVMLATLAGIGCKKEESSTKPATKAEAGSAQAEGSAKVETGSAAPAAAAGDPDPWAKKAPAKEPLKAPFLWAMEKDGKTSYVLGTIHKGVDAEQRLPQFVFDKLDASPTFAMETDINSAAGDMQSLIECVGCSLKKQLSKEQYQKLEDVLGKSTVAKIEGLKPMVAATMVSLQFMPETPAMDGVLHARAQRLNKKLVYLEDAKGAAKVLAKWMDVRALKMMLDDLEGGKKQMAEMLTAYLEGDDVKLLAINSDEKEKTLAAGYTAAEYDQQQADMLYNRNAAWIPAIEKLHADGGGFVAVGTLHLVGPKSVREMLEAKGYKFTRVTN